MRSILLLGLSLLLLLPTKTLAEQVPPEEEISMEDGIQYWMGEINLSGWEQAYLALPDDVQSLFGTDSIGEIIEAFIQEGRIREGTGQSVFQALLKITVEHAAKGLAFFLAIALLSGILRGLTTKDAVAGGDAAAFFFRCITLSALLVLYMDAVTALWQVTEQAAGFLEVAFPALLILITAVGATASAAALQPTALLLSGSIAGVIRSAILPLALMGSIAGILDQLFATSRLKELSKLLVKMAKWGMGAISTIFIGSASIRGLAAASLDSVTLRSAKYAAGSLLPVVGGMVSGTMDTMLGCAILVKSGAGLAALLIILGIALIPLAKAAGLMFMFRIAAALSQPLCEKQLSGLYGAAADGLSLLMGITIGGSLVFLSLITILILIGNAGGLL